MVKHILAILNDEAKATNFRESARQGKIIFLTEGADFNLTTYDNIYCIVGPLLSSLSSILHVVVSIPIF
jgi:hypothetical protein